MMVEQRREMWEQWGKGAAKGTYRITHMTWSVTDMIMSHAMTHYNRLANGHLLCTWCKDHYYTILIWHIKAFGCQILSYSARSDPSVPCISSFPKYLLVMPSHLESFSSSCNNIFSPYITLCHSPLRKLVLQDAGLSTCTWGKLLQSLDLPLLICLEVDCQCSITTLLTFLQWHPCIQYLCISTYGKESTWQSQCLPICLPSLQTLAGPPVYLKSLLQYIDHPILVTVLLSKLADIKPGVPQILQVLDCVQSLPHLHDTHIFPSKPSPSKFFVGYLNDRFDPPKKQAMHWQ